MILRKKNYISWSKTKEYKEEYFSVRLSYLLADFCFHRKYPWSNTFRKIQQKTISTLMLYYTIFISYWRDIKSWRKTVGIKHIVLQKYSETITRRKNKLSHFGPRISLLNLFNAFYYINNHYKIAYFKTRNMWIYHILYLILKAVDISCLKKSATKIRKILYLEIK